LAAIGRNTEWHEAYGKYSVAKMNGANERKMDAEIV
jgi:hypothetical protein